MRGWIRWSMVAAAGLLLAPEASAQMPQRGARSLQLSAVGRNEVGLWRMLSERTNVGLGVGIGLARRETEDSAVGEQTAWNVSLVPSLKRYGATVGRFAPYLFASLPLSLAGQSRDEAEGSGLGIGAAGAVGLDWFPVRNVSVGSHAGLQVNRQSSEHQSGTIESESTQTVLGTFSSGFTLHIYF